MKTLSTVLREQNITKRTDILEFVKNSELVKKSGGGNVDTEYVGFVYGDSNAYFKFGKTGNSRIYAGEMFLVSTGGTSLETFNEKIKNLDKKIEGIKKEKQVFKDKIKFLEESGAPGFVENEYRAYQAIQTINKENLTDFEKAKIISDLIN